MRGPCGICLLVQTSVTPSGERKMYRLQNDGLNSLNNYPDPNAYNSCML